MDVDAEQRDGSADALLSAHTRVQAAQPEQNHSTCAAKMHVCLSQRWIFPNVGCWSETEKVSHPNIPTHLELNRTLFWILAVQLLESSSSLKLRDHVTPGPAASASGLAHLLCVLLEEAKLEALVQLQLPDVPHLMEMLPGGVELIQQTGHLANSTCEETQHASIGCSCTMLFISKNSCCSHTTVPANEETCSEFFSLALVKD